LIALNCYTQNQLKDATNISVSIPKEIQVKNISDSQKNSLDENMPWIAALIIGVLSAGVNFWIGHKLRQSNERNLQRQIESSNNIAMTQFKTTIATKNRQEWINELRHEISELLTAFGKASITDNSSTREEFTRYSEKILYSKAKIELLTNSQKPEQKELQDKIEDLFEAFVEKDGKFKPGELANLRSKIILSANKLLDLHWKKIKNLQ